MTGKETRQGAATIAHDKSFRINAAYNNTAVKVSFLSKYRRASKNRKVHVHLRPKRIVHASTDGCILTYAANKIHLFAALEFGNFCEHPYAFVSVSENHDEIL